MYYLKMKQVFFNLFKDEIIKKYGKDDMTRLPNNNYANVVLPSISI